jgi:hypothetical protein
MISVSCDNKILWGDRPLYLVIDRLTGEVVTRCKTLKGASRSVDRLDNAYGGYRYYHKRITE